jgi:plasmid stabilization system protein ParE
MKHRFLEPAWAELQEAVEHYDARRPGLGDELGAEVRKTIDRILNHPNAWPRIAKRTRRCRVTRFPYAVLYQIRLDGIVIVAVAHLRRDPSYWRDRIEP